METDLKRLERESETESNTGKQGVADQKNRRWKGQPREGERTRRKRKRNRDPSDVVEMSKRVRRDFDHDDEDGDEHRRRHVIHWWGEEPQNDTF